MIIGSLSSTTNNIILLCIVTSIQLFGEEQYRNQFRQLFTLFSTNTNTTTNNTNTNTNTNTNNNKFRICTLQEYTNSITKSNNNTIITVNDCSLVYTFLIVPYEKQNQKYEKQKQQQMQYGTDWNETDMSYLYDFHNESTTDRTTGTVQQPISILLSNWLQQLQVQQQQQVQQQVQQQQNTHTTSTTSNHQKKILFDYIGFMNTRSMINIDSMIHYLFGSNSIIQSQQQQQQQSQSQNQQQQVQVPIIFVPPYPYNQHTIVSRLSFVTTFLNNNNYENNKNNINIQTTIPFNYVTNNRHLLTSTSNHNNYNNNYNNMNEIFFLSNDICQELVRYTSTTISSSQQKRNSRTNLKNKNNETNELTQQQISLSFQKQKQRNLLLLQNKPQKVSVIDDDPIDTIFYNHIQSYIQNFLLTTTSLLSKSKASSKSQSSRQHKYNLTSRRRRPYKVILIPTTTTMTTTATTTTIDNDSDTTDKSQIHSSDQFWINNSIKQNGGRKWNIIWKNEIQRIQSLLLLLSMSSQTSSLDDIYNENDDGGNNDDDNSTIDFDNNNNNSKASSIHEQKDNRSSSSSSSSSTNEDNDSSSKTDESTTGSTSTTKSIFTTTTLLHSSINGTNNSLYDYWYSSLNNNTDMFLIKWNTTGTILETTSYIRHDDWFQQKELDIIRYMNSTTTTNTTTGSSSNDFVKLAIVFNTDVMHELDWTNIRSPIPILVYTVPNTISIHDNGPTSNFYLIPSPYDRSGYNQWCIWKTNNEYALRPFEQRISQIVWRGSIHSTIDRNRITLIEMSKNQSTPSSTTQKQRKQQQQLRSTTVKNKKKKKQQQQQKYRWLNAEIINDDNSNYMSIEQMVQYKYQIDIGGQSGTSWGGLRWKMCTGCLVFKVSTWSYDWWHNLLQPYVHYVPVHYNLSNLYSQYKWIQQNPDIAYRIAQAGATLCNTNVQINNVNNYLHSIIQSLPTIPSNHTLVEQANDIILRSYTKK